MVLKPKKPKLLLKHGQEIYSCSNILLGVGNMEAHLQRFYQRTVKESSLN